MTAQQLKVILVTLFITIPLLKGFAQTDDQSKGVYREIYIKKSWKKLDKNKDSVYEESENKRFWKRLKYLDINKDNTINEE